MLLGAPTQVDWIALGTGAVTAALGAVDALGTVVGDGVTETATFLLPPMSAPPPITATRSTAAPAKSRRRFIWTCLRVGQATRRRTCGSVSAAWRTAAM